jgi:hypothetical protein
VAEGSWTVELDERSIVGLITSFIHSGGAKGQFTGSFAELLFAPHRAAQSKLRRLRDRLSPEPMRRVMKSARLRLPARGAEWVAVMHGTYPIPQRGTGPLLPRVSARGQAPRGDPVRGGRQPCTG